MRLALLVAAWLAGVVLGLEAEIDAAPVLLLLLATPPAGLLLYFRRYSLWPAVLAGVLLLGLLRVEAADAPQALLVTEERQTVTIAGRIVDDPEATRQRTKFVLEVESVDRGTGREPLNAKVLVYAEPPNSLASSREPPFFRYGDTLVLEGELQRPRPIVDFDYRSYLANQGISGILWSREAILVSQEAGSRWRGWVFDLRRELSERIEDALPPRQSALAQALLLGQRGRLSGGLVEDFRETGTSHLLAISGLHVGVLLVMSLGAATWLLGRRRQLYLLFPLALIWLYALVSGEPASVVRAAIMGSVFLAALALAAAVMVAFSPMVLRQVSFQLSFAAMAGIAVALPYQARATAAIALRTTTIPAWIANILSWAASALVVSAGATLATWPLVAFNFHRIPCSVFLSPCWPCRRCPLS